MVINIPQRVRGDLLPSAEITSHMKSNFPYIRFMLLVGIGGGAPSIPRNDIHVGDVVFGDCVIQYKTGQELEDSLEIDPERLQPPQQLSAAVTRLRATLHNGDPLEEALDEIASKSERNMNRYRRPIEDRLWKSSLLHQDDVCECLRSVWIHTPWLVTREYRFTDLIMTHRGIIGSSDQLPRNAKERDRLNLEQKIVCFDMEAADVMRSTKCITVRGIADYADGHKNDEWHSYAALSAAVCAKKLLLALDPETVRGTKIDLNQEEFTRRFQGVTGLINAGLSRDESNFQDTLKGVQDANHLLGDQAKLFKHFADAQDVKDQETRDLLKSCQEKLQQQVNDLEQQVENQQRRNASSDYVARREWDSLKEQVERRKKDVKATEALTMVGEFTDIGADHIGNDDVRRVSEYRGLAGKAFNKFHLPVPRSGDGSDQTSLQSGVPTPPTSVPITAANTGESSTPSKSRSTFSMLKGKMRMSGKRSNRPNPEHPSPLPITPSEGIKAENTQHHSIPGTSSPLPNTPSNGQ